MNDNIVEEYNDNSYDYVYYHFLLFNSSPSIYIFYTYKHSILINLVIIMY